MLIIFWRIIIFFRWIVIDFQVILIVRVVKNIFYLLPINHHPPQRIPHKINVVSLFLKAGGVEFGEVSGVKVCLVCV